MEMLNPFIYGKPVPADRHINREQALRTIFSRVRNKESTAIVGEPQIGKTSLLKYVLYESTLKTWLKEDANHLIPVEIDIYAGWLSPEKKPIDFWRFIFEIIEQNLEEGSLKNGIKALRANQFGSATLVNYFKLLGSAGKRVLLVVDEFDSLLYHPNFSNAEFFGGLRSIATNTDGLQLITASITSVEEMDDISFKINPIGSPFFNSFTNVKLELFDEDSIEKLIEQTLQPTGVVFSSLDMDFIVRVSGRHPYRLQAVCASLFDSIITQKDDEQKYAYASEKFLSQTEHHFNRIWKKLDDKSRTVLVIMTILWLQGIVLGKEYSFGEIEKSQMFEPELQRLAKLGFVEKIGKKANYQWDSENFLVWRDQKWQIACEGIVWWLTTSVIANSREIPTVEKWLHDLEVVGFLLTRKQWDIVREWIKKAPATLGDTLNTVLVEFLKRLFAKKP